MDTVKIMNHYVNERMAKSGNAVADDGMLGKAFEIAVRSWIMGRMVKSVKSQGKTDIRFTLNGKRYTCEIKTACGSISTAESNQYIIYCPDVDINYPAEFQAYVFTREQWHEFVNGYTGRGQFTRIDNKGERKIQSFYVSETKRPKASKPIARYIESVLYEMPTLWDVFEK